MAFQACDGFSEGIWEQKRSFVRVYIGLWRALGGESIGRASRGGSRSPQAWSFGVRTFYGLRRPWGRL